MINVAVSGAAGRMGQAVCEAVEGADDLALVGRADPLLDTALQDVLGDADVVLVDLGERWTLRAEDLLQRHRISPYIGLDFRGRVRRTIRRGETIYMDGRVTAESRGRLVRPERN